VNWFWVMTLQWAAGPGRSATNTVHGNISAALAAELGSRRAAYLYAYEEAKSTLSVPGTASAIVLFYSVDPDDLAGTP
jgi:hypothetical protein